VDSGSIEANVERREYTTEMEKRTQISDYNVIPSSTSRRVGIYTRVVRTVALAGISV
jgi:hypothetical protein